MRSDREMEPRLLVVGDPDRLGPIVKQRFAGRRVAGVRGYLAGIAEIARGPTQGVIVGYDAECRDFDAALAAIKAAAGDGVPVVFCCEPAFENVGRRLLRSGADDYVIFPPEPGELERALGILPRADDDGRAPEPEAAPPAAIEPAPSAEELTRLADLLPRLQQEDSGLLDAMADLVRVAVDAEGVTMTVDGRTGCAGRPNAGGGAAELTYLLRRGGQRVGQMRVAGRRAGGFSAGEQARLDHYAVLLGRLLEAAGRANQWRELALTDDLTGLPNRRQLMRFLEEKIRWATREHSTVTVLIFDIDDFKRYNDEYGHDAGDEILTEVGRLFVQCSRETDLVARHGGDEFVVVFWDPRGPRLAGSHHPQAVIDVLQRFRKALRAHTFSRLGPEARGALTISGGLAHSPAQATTAPALLEAADRALLQAKKAGKDRFWLVGGGDVPVVEADRAAEHPPGA